VLKKIREFTVLEFPTDVHIDRDAKLLISSLLRRKETDRLGSKDPVGDYKSIKEHSWFSEVRSSPFSTTRRRDSLAQAVAWFHNPHPSRWVRSGLAVESISTLPQIACCPPR
jgi:hypothetical protein